MSGGHWDYEDGRIKHFAERLARDEHELEKILGVDFVSPIVFALEACGDLLRELDRHICADDRIEDPAKRLRAFKRAMRRALR